MFLQKRAMDDVLGDINIADPTANGDEDEEMADVAPRAVQKQEKKRADQEGKSKDGKSKEDKKREKKERKKRKLGEEDGVMDVDEDEEIKAKKEKKEKKEKKQKIKA